MPCGLPWSEAFVRQLSEKEFRDEFVADQVRVRIAAMIRALREQGDRRWSQAELGERMDKAQSVISRLENPDYGKASLQTLFEVAAAFDLPLMVDFPEWDDWFRRVGDLRPACLSRASFDVEKLAAQAKAATLAVSNGEVLELNLRRASSPETGSVSGSRISKAGQSIEVAIAQ